MRVPRKASRRGNNPSTALSIYRGEKRNKISLIIRRAAILVLYTAASVYYFIIHNARVCVEYIFKPQSSDARSFFSHWDANYSHSRLAANFVLSLSLSWTPARISHRGNQKYRTAYVSIKFWSCDYAHVSYFSVEKLASFVGWNYINKIHWIQELFLKRFFHPIQRWASEYYNQRKIQMRIPITD